MGIVLIMVGMLICFKSEHKKVGGTLIAIGAIGVML